MREPSNPVERAIVLLGSEAKLGRAVGYSQAGINKAKRSGRVSAELAIKIEEATGGQVARHMMRPDLFPVPMRAAE